ncbi:MAG: hypothetical protein RKR03_17115 [Candidatus Competibacter sp.]|nr:hypothetical protein [Candidatus Competibacter sp.]
MASPCRASHRSCPISCCRGGGGGHGQPALLMRQAGLRNIPGKLLLSASLAQALARVRHYLDESSAGRRLVTDRLI